MGTRSNRSRIGATVEVAAGDLKQADAVHSGRSLLSQNAMRLHFGLGSRTRRNLITIYWPSGVVDRIRDIPVNRKVVIKKANKSQTEKGG
jgi:hypothetical protein